MLWSGENEEMLRRFAESGMSAGVIAKRFTEIEREEVTRNTIAGKCRRLGIELRGELRFSSKGTRGEIAANTHHKTLASRQNGQKPAPAPKPPRVSAAEKRRALVESLARAAEAAPATQKASPRHAPPVGAKTILEIGAHQCRFSVADPTEDRAALFCARPVDHGPYCAAHALRAYPALREA